MFTKYNYASIVGFTLARKIAVLVGLGQANKNSANQNGRPANVKRRNSPNRLAKFTNTSQYMRRPQ